MTKTLIIFAHPLPRQSKANRVIIDELASLEHVTVRDLYHLYPYFNLDPVPEKRLLTEHELIVFQHPMYWYSMPALLKLWFDEVLEFGFAYGPGGESLKNKKMLVSITAGGSEDAYSAKGVHGVEIQTFLAGYKQTAKLCGMKYLEPQVLYGASAKKPDLILEHAKKLKTLIAQLQRENEPHSLGV